MMEDISVKHHYNNGTVKQINKAIQLDPFVLITGASSGIGKALAFEFAKLNRNLLLVALPDSGLEEVGEDLNNLFNITVATYAIDLTEADAIHKLHQWFTHHRFQIDILINNAGFGNLQLFSESSLSSIQHMMALNTTALITMTHTFLPDLKKQPAAYIMNVGSLASLFPIPSKTIYSATKSFVYSFSAALHTELEHENVHVCCLCPGSTYTNGHAENNVPHESLKGTAFTQQPAQVAAEAVKKMFQKKRRIFPGWQNKLIYNLSRFMPPVLTRFVVKRIFMKMPVKKTEVAL